MQDILKVSVKFNQNRSVCISDILIWNFSIFWFSNFSKYGCRSGKKMIKLFLSSKAKHFKGFCKFNQNWCVCNLDILCDDVLVVVFCTLVLHLPLSCCSPQHISFRYGYLTIQSILSSLIVLVISRPLLISVNTFILIHSANHSIGYHHYMAQLVLDESNGVSWTVYNLFFHCH